MLTPKGAPRLGGKLPSKSTKLTLTTAAVAVGLLTGCASNDWPTTTYTWGDHVAAPFEATGAKIKGGANAGADGVKEATDEYVAPVVGGLAEGLTRFLVGTIPAAIIRLWGGIGDGAVGAAGVVGKWVGDSAQQIKNAATGENRTKK